MPRASFFLRITDSQGEPIKGEAEEHDFEGAIEVTSWDWGVADKIAKDRMKTGDAASSETGVSGESRNAREGETGKETYLPTPLRFSKPTDRSTTRLLYAMINEEKLLSAVFTLRQQWRAGVGDGTETNEEFLLHLLLNDVRITGYDFNARSSSLDVELDEDWVFSYRTIQFDYRSAPGKYRHGPGLFDEFVLPPGSTTKALKKPEKSTKDLDKEMAELRAENEKLRRAKGSSG